MHYAASVSGIALLVLLRPCEIHAQGVRPVRDDIGYCWTQEQMDRLVNLLSETAQQETAAAGLVAGISPHDDYLYAAGVYYPLFKALRANEVVIFGVTHRAVSTEIGDPHDALILDDYSSWRGMNRDVPISRLREFIQSRLDTSFWTVNRKAHRLEHSIEAMLPFLQYFNHGVRITPIMVTAMSFERMQQVSEALAGVISEYARNRGLIPGKDIAFLISSDANHYGKDFDNAPFGEDEAAHRRAVELDKNLCNAYLTGPVAAGKIRALTLQLSNVVWCGRYSVPFGLLTADATMQMLAHKHISGDMLRYSDSYSEGVLPLKQSGMGLTAPFSLKHWVGWFSAAYSLE